MSRNIWIGIIVVIVIAAGVWWYFNQSNDATTQQPSASAQATTTSPSGDWQTKTVADMNISFQMPQDWVYFRGATNDPSAGNEFSIGTQTDESSMDGDLTVVQMTTSTSQNATYCPISTCDDASFAQLRAMSNGSIVVAAGSRIDQGGNTIQTSAITKTGNTSIDGYPAVTVGAVTWVRTNGTNWYIIEPKSAANQAVFEKFLATLTLH